MQSTHKQTTPRKPVYDLERRSTNFGKQIIKLCKRLPRNTINYPLVNQIVRSSGSIGANYREANDALGSKDFIRCLKISRKETKETIHWLELLEEANPKIQFTEEINYCIGEAIEIRNILSSMIVKFLKKK